MGQKKDDLFHSSSATNRNESRLCVRLYAFDRNSRVNTILSCQSKTNRAMIRYSSSFNPFKLESFSFHRNQQRSVWDQGPESQGAHPQTPPEPAPGTARRTSSGARRSSNQNAPPPGCWSWPQSSSPPPAQSLPPPTSLMREFQRVRTKMVTRKKTHTLTRTRGGQRLWKVGDENADLGDDAVHRARRRVRST